MAIARKPWMCSLTSASGDGGIETGTFCYIQLHDFLGHCRMNSHSAGQLVDGYVGPVQEKPHRLYAIDLKPWFYVLSKRQLWHTEGIVPQGPSKAGFKPATYQLRLKFFINCRVLKVLRIYGSSEHPDCVFVLKIVQICASNFFSSSKWGKRGTLNWHTHLWYWNKW